MPKNYYPHTPNTDEEEYDGPIAIGIPTNRNILNIPQPRHKLVFYPPGGAYNKKRASEQKYFTQLLDALALDYSVTKDKSKFIQAHILNQFPDQRAYEYIPKTQQFRPVPFEAAYQRIAQKLRDRLKVIRRKGGRTSSSSGGDSQSTSKTNTGAMDSSQLCMSCNTTIPQSSTPTKNQPTTKTATLATTSSHHLQHCHDNDDSDDDDDKEEESSNELDLERMQEPQLKEEEEEEENTLSRLKNSSNNNGNISSSFTKKRPFDGETIERKKRGYKNHSQQSDESRTTDTEDLVPPSFPCSTALSVLQKDCEEDDNVNLPAEKIKDQLIIHLREEVEHMRRMASLMQQKIQVLEQLANFTTSLDNPCKKRKKQRRYGSSSMDQDDDWSPSPVNSNKRSSLLRSPSLALHSLEDADALYQGKQEEV